MKHSDFVHLHLHSQYSLLDGMIRPDALLERAKKYKMPAVAVTDHGNMFGAVDFYQKAMKAGVKPIIGCEVYVAPESRTDKTPSARGGRVNNHHLVLLVKNHTGYVNLCKMLSLAYKEGFYYRPRVDKELLTAHNEGLIALSACLNGEVAKNIVRGQTDKALEAADFYKETFKDRFYLELQDAGIEEQKKANEGLIDISKKLGLPLVATNDAHYLDKDDAKYHDILLCIQTGKTVNAEDRMRFSTDELYFKSPEEMAALFSHVPEAIKNTVAIAERCNLELSLGEPHLPIFELPKGETLVDRLVKDSAGGLERRLGVFAASGMDVDSMKPEYQERLNKELGVIKNMGFPGYFLIVADFIRHARERGIPVGPGRGSAAGSLVAYALGITNLDPIKYNLLFERFLNPDRISLPDIDVDFCIEGRDEIIKYVSDKYGEENVTQIITFGQMKARAVIRDVGRALDMPYGDVDRIAKLVPNQLGITIDKALAQEPELKKAMEDDPRVGELIEAGKRLEGLPRHASTHAAGVVISNKPLVEYLPLYMGQKDNVVTTQYPMNDVEKIGLVKFDFLGLKTLTVIDRALMLIKQTRGVELDLDILTLDDEKTYKLLSSANTNGIFQLESSGIKDLLRKLKPSCFEDLTAAVALYRPGPLKSGMIDDFISRKHGKTKIKYVAPELAGALENTYGVMVYQEQVMEIARTLAGFTPGEADHLRKAMGKKLTEQMNKAKKKFIEGAVERKIAGKTAETIFDLMANFAEYGFNKSHSAAYALIAYQTAYLKTYYMVEFMAALLTLDMGDTDKVIRYMSECKEKGIKVTPPDLNISTMNFTVDGKKIVFGLGAVKNVGSAAIESMLAVREDGEFTSLLDFLSRVDTRKVNKKTVESLIKCGAMDFTGETRATLLASLDTMMESAQGLQRDRAMGQKSIFEMMDGPAMSHAEPSYARLPEWDDKEKLALEKETLGLYISSHPLEGHASELEGVTTDSTEHLMERRSDEIVTVGGVVVDLREINTKKGDRMAFIKLEDLSGSVELVVFAKLYAKVRETAARDKLIVVTGRVDRGDTEVKIIADEIVPIEQARAVAQRNVHIHASVDGLNVEKFMALKKILGTRRGTSRVIFHMLYPDKSEVVIGLPPLLSINPNDRIFESINKTLPGSQITVR